MVLGRAGLRLEAQKFAVYLLIPITASLAFNEPSVQKWAADYFQFMKYPANPKTNLKDEYEALKKQREEEIEWKKRMAGKREEGRKEYLKQLKQLGSNSVTAAATTELENKRERRGWLGTWRGRGTGDGDGNSSSDGSR
ncbi:hypothetical protein ACHAXH_005342 [Discostella pseudostelligera]